MPGWSGSAAGTRSACLVPGFPQPVGDLGVEVRLRVKLQVVHPDTRGGVDHFLEPGGADPTRQRDRQHGGDVGIKVPSGPPEAGIAAPFPEGHLAFCCPRASASGGRHNRPDLFQAQPPSGWSQSSGAARARTLRRDMPSPGPGRRACWHYVHWSARTEGMSQLAPGPGRAAAARTSLRAASLWGLNN